MPVRVSGSFGNCWIELKDDGRMYLVRTVSDSNSGKPYPEMNELSENEQLALEQLLKMADTFKNNPNK